jgi:hypothetical protein
MRIPQLVAAAALLAVVGTARASSSPIPSNYVDDFGPVAAGESSAREDAVASHASPIPSNYVDDFGVAQGAGASATAAPAAAPAHASIVPSNYIDDFGLSDQPEVGVSTASVKDGSPAPSNS